MYYHTVVKCRSISRRCGRPREQPRCKVIPTEKAFEWYEKSAKLGNADAQHNLGVCYAKGEGVEQSWEKAFEWYEKSAKQGDADAQFNLGVCNKKGEGVEQSWEKAFEWC